MGGGEPEGATGHGRQNNETLTLSLSRSLSRSCFRRVSSIEAGSSASRRGARSGSVVVRLREVRG